MTDWHCSEKHDKTNRVDSDWGDKAKQSRTCSFEQKNISRANAHSKKMAPNNKVRGATMQVQTAPFLHTTAPDGEVFSMPNVQFPKIH